MMKCCRFIVALCVLSIMFSPSASDALRMRTEDFAVLCSKGTPLEVQQALNSGAKPTEQVLITAAYSNSDPEVIRVLISFAQNHYGLNFSKHPSVGSNVLNSAIRGGDSEVVRAIMSFGMNINARDSSGRRPLSEALRYGIRSEEPERQKIISMLREAGARR